MRTWIGVDTGGTFTDFIALYQDGSTRTLKLLSTPDDPSRAVLEGVAQLIKEGQRVDVTYGSTVATNALLERRGARSALITNAGFEDLLTLGRQARPHLYRLRVEPATPLITRELTIGLSGRLAPSGQEEAPLNQAELASLAARLSAANVESVAVCLLHSYANPLHEEAVGQALASLGVPVSLSSQILPEYREYERAATTAVNAYVAPKMEGHLRRLAAGLSDLSGERSQISLRVMQSNGGAIRADLAAREPVRTILSGPAGGVVGAFLAAQRAGFSSVLTFDMGGTSTDVSLCDGQIRTTAEGKVAGLPVRVPLVDVHTVGAGGGSIARLDQGGALKVGPESASAVPGPASYGRGGPPTVTDANLVLGRLDPAQPLGGSLVLQPDLAWQSIAPLAAAMKMSVYEAAEGIVRVANAAMEKALRVISIERGFDPRGFALLSFGGAGGLHACALVEALSMQTVLVPGEAGVLSALGMLEADVVRDASRTFFASADISSALLEEALTPLRQKVTQELLEEGFLRSEVETVCSVDLRYQGQSFEVSLTQIDANTRLREAFEAEYQRRYGYALSGRKVELVTLRARSIARQARPTRRMILPSFEAAPRGVRQVYEQGQSKEALVYDRSMLGVEVRLAGPAIIVEPIATTWLPTGWFAEVHSSGALLLRALTPRAKLAAPLPTQGMVSIFNSE